MSSQRPPSLIALMSGPDRPGIVARTSGWIYENSGNIIHADQHHDHEANIFFQRLEWTHAEGQDLQTRGRAFKAMAEEDLGLNVSLAVSTDRPRIAIFVSKIDHCFFDLLLRWQAGELKGELVCVISNHETLREPSERAGLPFHHVAIPKDGKARAEAKALELVRAAGVELIVMARYMQILSDAFLADFGCPVINIHHSFLPAFAGARPYHQAHERGVKLIGATAHYATAELDAGPIIHQDTTRISHRHGPQELIRRGRDLEKTVLAQAVRWHLDHRILVYNNKTVVLD